MVLVSRCCILKVHIFLNKFKFSFCTSAEQSTAIFLILLYKFYAFFPFERLLAWPLICHLAVSSIYNFDSFIYYFFCTFKLQMSYDTCLQVQVCCIHNVRVVSRKKNFIQRVIITVSCLFILKIKKRRKKIIFSTEFIIHGISSLIFSFSGVHTVSWVRLTPNDSKIHKFYNIHFIRIRCQFAVFATHGTYLLWHDGIYYAAR